MCLCEGPVLHVPCWLKLQNASLLKLKLLPNVTEEKTDGVIPERLHRV